VLERETVQVQLEAPLAHCESHGAEEGAYPITKVGTRDHHSGPFLAVEKGDGFEHIFNVWISMSDVIVRVQAWGTIRTSVSPVVALDLGNARDVAGSERTMSRSAKTMSILPMGSGKEAIVGYRAVDDVRAVGG
jgi:hypothetical protein